ncbi:MAG: hypothetical protein K2K07_03720 [Lachnospiraceae bacterium]|nr:hypothetical protein [Lachnospiraceae bacterium]
MGKVRPPVYRAQKELTDIPAYGAAFLLMVPIILQYAFGNISKDFNDFIKIFICMIHKSAKVSVDQNG